MYIKLTDSNIMAVLCSLQLLSGMSRSPSKPSFFYFLTGMEGNTARYSEEELQRIMIVRSPSTHFFVFS